MRGRRNPAVVAGLLGAATLAAPQTAHALSLPVPLTETIDGIFGSPTIALAAGFAGGVVLTGAVALTASAISRHRRNVTERQELEAEERAVSERHPRHMRAEAPVTEPEQSSAEPKPSHHPSHAASNYEQIAENYVSKATFRARMARRAEGVAATLRERMGASMMEGVPIIERADGSVGDVGTSWWQTAVGSTAIHGTESFVSDTDAYAIPSDFSMTDGERLARAEGISRRVAQIDEGTYPELQTARNLDEDDEWLRALRSLDEKIAEESPAAVRESVSFVDTVGGVDTLDEPDGLEPETGFIPFRTPAGHPEVVDTGSYIDYLIEDEFSKNASHGSKRVLRVLEGGTSASKRVSRHLGGSSKPVKDEEESYVAKHFSTPMAAQA